MSETETTIREGTILLADPFLLDPNFQRSVVLLTENNEEGTVGHVLNKPTRFKLSEIVADFAGFDAPVFLGGPVYQENLYFIHTRGDDLEGSVKVIDGLYWGGDFEALKDMINSKQMQPGDIRFFLGYAGWSKDQLKDELREKSWFVTIANKGYVLNSQYNGLWQEMMKSMGDDYRFLINAPRHPSLN